MNAAASPVDVTREPLRRRLGASLVVRGALGTWRARIGLGIVGSIVLLAVFGPWLGGSPYDVVGLPSLQPSSAHWLGTDALGRDAFARYLSGGRVLVLVAFLSTGLAYVVGIAVGMAAGYERKAFDAVTVALVDLLLAFPPIVFVLLLIAAAGPHLSLVIVAIAATHAPRIVRIVRTVTTEIAAHEFVEAAVARGERVAAILQRDILPNILTPVLTDFGLRLSGSVILFSSVSYLGLGQPPPQADWALMISENRAGLLVQPWLVIAPAATIALLTIGVNLVADGIARASGRYVTSRDV